MDSKRLALRCRELAENKKAGDVVVLDMRTVSSVADYFVIASGTSDPHLRAIRDEILDTLREERHLEPRTVEGTLQAAWLVIDYFDVLVHLMKPEARKHYDLENLWGDAPRIKLRPRSPRKSRGAPD